MSALGDYIHLNTENYLIYGVSQKGKEKRLSLAEVYKNQYKKNLERVNNLPDISKKTLKTLEERVHQHFPEGKDSAKENLVKTLGTQKLSEHFKEYLLNNINGNLTRRAHIFKNTISTMDTNNSLVDIEKAKKLRANLYENIRSLNDKFKNGEPISLNTTPTTIAKNFTAFFNALGMSLKDGGYIVNPNEIKNMDVLSAMKALLMDMSLSEANRATINGQIGEQTVKMCGDTIVRKALTTVNGVIKGADVSKFQMNESIIPKDVQAVFKKDTGINLYQVRSSQDKVDVQIVVNKNPLNVSVKAYSSKGNSLRTHLQDVSLLTSLATTEKDFANHWLNLHCAQGYVKGTQTLDLPLKEHIKYEALVSGNLLKNNSLKADTFVAIDVTKGRVFSASTKEILKNNKIGKFYLKPSLSSLRIEGNTFASSFAQRISNILQNVHAVKISVALNVSLK